jgi:hypothetical protein
MCNKPAESRGWKNRADLLIDIQMSMHGSKAQKRLSMRNVATSSNHVLRVKFYNFLIINTTSQKAHHAKKKA